MITITQQTPIASGTTCDIYACSEQHILKLFKPCYQRGYMQHEAYMVKHAQQAGLTNLILVDERVMNNRQALIYKRIDGQCLESRLRAKPWRLHYFARRFAHIHAQLHEQSAPDAFPAQQSEVRCLVEQSEFISSDIRERLMGQLEHLSLKNEVSHNDFTLRNVLLDRQGNSTIIDWNGATRGDASVDVASCWLKLMCDAWANNSTRYWERYYIRYFVCCYLRHYLRLRPQVKSTFRYSLPFAALQLMSTAAVPQRRWLTNFLDIKNMVTTQRV